MFVFAQRCAGVCLCVAEVCKCRSVCLCVAEMCKCVFVCSTQFE